MAKINQFGKQPINVDYTTAVRLINKLTEYENKGNIKKVNELVNQLTKMGVLDCDGQFSMYLPDELIDYCDTL